jgi:hypothetical protein
MILHIPTIAFLNENVESERRSCFDKPVLSEVEGLSTNGKFQTITALNPFALSLSKGEGAYSFSISKRIPRCTGE